MASLCEGVCDGLWEGNGVESGNGGPICEYVEIGEIISPGGATATWPAVIALSGLTVGGEGMPPGELNEKLKNMSDGRRGLKGCRPCNSRSRKKSVGRF